MYTASVKLQPSNTMYPNTPTVAIITKARMAPCTRRRATRGSNSVLSEMPLLPDLLRSPSVIMQDYRESIRSATRSMMPRIRTIQGSSGPYSPKYLEVEFCEVELPLYGVLGSTHGPGPMLIIPTEDALCSLLEQALRREAMGAAGGSSTFRKHMLTSRQMPCRL